MTTTLKTKPKTAKRFRVKIGDQYANLNFDLHEKGVLVKCGALSYRATEFKTNATAGNAIQRTYEFKNKIRDSMYADWGKFDCVKYKDAPEVEEYQIDAPKEE